MPKGIKGSSPTYNCKNCGEENKVKHSTTNTYCNNHCQSEYQYKDRIKQWLEEGKKWGKNTPPWVKRYLKETRGSVCEICNLNEWMGNPITLECDHTDGNPYNNGLDNLRLICPNCHSYTDSFKGKNRGNGRKDRYK